MKKQITRLEQVSVTGGQLPPRFCMERSTLGFIDDTAVPIAKIDRRHILMATLVDEQMDPSTADRNRPGCRLSARIGPAPTRAQLSQIR